MTLVILAEDATEELLLLSTKLAGVRAPLGGEAVPPDMLDELWDDMEHTDGFIEAV